MNDETDKRVHCILDLKTLSILDSYAGKNKITRTDALTQIINKFSELESIQNNTTLEQINSRLKRIEDKIF